MGSELWTSRESPLILRASAGDEEAFDRLFAAHRATLARLSLRMLRNRDDANDAVQETFLKAYRAIGEFDPERPLRPWLCRICANCCVDMVRTRRREGEGLWSDPSLYHTEVALDVRATGAIQYGQIIEAIERLPERYRRIVLMRHFRHMAVNEIARELGTPEGTIKSWLFRARTMLKKDLTPVMG